ncbi:hypothetical protein DCAR_0415492 [Daucus carota subsp. sativus]|uniref:Uncharacterized protein n=1 Tax=Daucus carota subsp. sativus TaxID=79200 RepID=A0AAF0WWE5_DAUCS|nr:PREDICTED: uncharacterized protein LOC108217175 [Daucus carota subsp. sativus]WOG96161.1 hypothetical protein DCAR_0415492 [Daucus carota subsp. sativus]
MEILIKQMRSKYSGVRQRNRDTPGRVRFSGVELEIGEPNRATIGQNDPNNFCTENNDRMIPISPPREAQDEKKRWFNTQMNQEYNYSDSTEYPSAVAAAVYAINSIRSKKVSGKTKIFIIFFNLLYLIFKTSLSFIFQ